MEFQKYTKKVERLNDKFATESAKQFGAYGRMINSLFASETQVDDITADISRFAKKQFSNSSNYYNGLFELGLDFSENLVNDLATIKERSQAKKTSVNKTRKSPAKKTTTRKK